MPGDVVGQYLLLPGFDSFENGGGHRLGVDLGSRDRGGHSDRHLDDRDLVEAVAKHQSLAAEWADPPKERLGKL